MKCPLCSYEYEANDIKKCAGCSKYGLCNARHCPKCGYEIPAQTKTEKIIRGIFKWE